MAGRDLAAARSRLIVALDVASEAEAYGLVDRLGEQVSTYKVGMQLFTAAGPDAVRGLVGRGKRVLLDLKLHEIPHSVAGAVRAAADLGVSMVTVHASGGRRMMEAAVAAATGTGLSVLALTVVTSLTAEDLREIGWDTTPAEQALRLARLAADSGCRGAISSPREAAVLRAALPAEAWIVTPGVRPVGAARDDQSRAATPTEALRAGATHLVVGRPITRASDPAEAARAILVEIAECCDGTA